jgi:hypothetical protein
MTRTVTAPNQKSATQTLPTLSQMIREGQADTVRHGQRTREALDYWFRQSERLVTPVLADREGAWPVAAMMEPMVMPPTDMVTLAATA